MNSNQGEIERILTEEEFSQSMDAVAISTSSTEVLLRGQAPEGPNHKAWRNKLKKAWAKRLRQEGFTKNEIRKIIKDMLKGLWGILKNIWRLYKVQRAYKKAKKDAGPEPAWGS